MKTTSAEERRVAASYIPCLFNISGFKIRRALDLPFGDPASVASLMELLDVNCLSKVGDEVRFRNPSLVMLRGFFYDGMYALDFGRAAPVDSFAGTPSPAYPLAQKQPQYAAAFRNTMDFGECVVRRAPVESRALILSPVETPAEAQAFSAIAPSLSGCVDAGQSFELNRSVVRGAISEPLYRMTRMRQSGAAK
jgi:hypothetical protein